MQYLLFTFIDQTTLYEAAQALHYCTGVPVHILEGQGNIVQSFGNLPSCCTADNPSCTMRHNTAATRAVGFGEAYTFTCALGLAHLVFPLVIKGTLFGSVLVGPFFIASSGDDSGVPDAVCITPEKANYLGRLVYRLFANLIADNELWLKENRQKMHQQSRINESIQMYKNCSERIKSSYPVEKEKELIARVKTGDAPAAKAILNELLGYVFFAGGNALDTLKTRAIELTSLLSRAAIEGGAATDEVLKINNRFLNGIQNINSLESLCFSLQESVEVFSECMFSRLPSKNYSLIRTAIEFICANFNTNITLEDVAAKVHLNSAYFSTLFKQSTGSSFKEYLNMIRVEESKRLLTSTDYSIIDIAIATGFEDQSYFSKVFKKYTGITPKQYRR